MERTIQITFSIYYKTIIGQNLYIAGSHPQLGSWKSPIPMKWTEGHIWKLTIPIKNPEFCYKHIIIQQGAMQWEDGIDRPVNLTNHQPNSAELKAIWNHMKITFLLYNPPYDPSKLQMRINGKIPELGAWEKEIIDMKLSKKLYSFNGQNTVMWKKTILCKMNDFPTKFDYKYTAIDHIKKVILWEREPSRQFLLSSGDHPTDDILVNNRLIKQDANFVTDLIFNKIGEYNIFVGPYPQSTDDVDTMFNSGVTAVICAQTDIDIHHRQINWTKMKAYYISKNIRLEHYPIHDFNHQDLIEKLPDGAAILNELLKEKRTVYIHCTAGMGRAPAIVVMYLCLFCKMVPDEAYEYVHKHRECAVPNILAIKAAYKNATESADDEEDKQEERKEHI